MGSEWVDQRPEMTGPRSGPVVASTNKLLVGLENGLSRLKDKLIGESSRLNVVAVVGMAGIGKTTLVDRAFQDLSIGRFFHYLAWAEVGPDRDPREVIAELLGPTASKFSQETSYSQLTEFMKASLPTAASIGRRLCIRKNILLSIKDINRAMLSVSKARSFLCSGQDHPYPLVVCSDFGLLRVLDVLSIRFYEFPMEILKLVQLRYLALTCSEIPASLSELANLHVLILRRHIRIKSSGAGPSYLPIEIWNMRRLRHLVVEGRDLPHPHGMVLTNLLTLSNVTSHSCAEDVLRGIPNLKKLGVCIEVSEHDHASDPSRVFDHLALLDRLESFKCAVVNPSRRSMAVARPDSVSNFPGALKKLALTGCRFPWEDMMIIGKLPRLQVLKLGCYAFEGPVWDVGENEFRDLRFLQLEDLDLEDWSGGGLILKRLERLIVRHCYRLREIPEGVDYIIYLQLVEVVDCSPSFVESAMRVKEMQQDLSNDDFQVLVESSWKEKSSRPRYSSFQA
ncbi:Unknown protein [Striga hermonthica]|uniref:NB-ARC domain-containing protein n=1 Tax=Striga hermonthica TaxID=68872 RepID=A0A9N7NUX9_STRHE|nr:Unknown protein [Striga hermonthica]